MSPTRRSFIKAGFFLVNAATGALLSVPVVSYVLDPVFKRRQRKWVELGPLEGFKGKDPKPARVKYTSAEGRTAVSKTENFWVMADGDPPVVYSSVCPHLGCGVSWKPEEDRFHCPCHDGLFNREGQVLGGPPPRPLTRMNVKIENGKILIEV